MGRALLVINTKEARAKAANWIARAPNGTRVTFQGPRRSLPQNSRMWAMLQDFSDQVEHGGRKYSPESWKAIFMHALGQECRFVPSLDGESFIPIGYRSSELSKAEMTTLIELVFSEGALRGVVWTDPTQEPPGVSPDQLKQEAATAA